MAGVPRPPFAARLLSWAAALVGGLTVAASLAFLLCDRGRSGLLPGLDRVLSLASLLVGNCLCFLILLARWRFRPRPAWLGPLLLVQSVPALGLLAWGAMLGAGAWQDSRAWAQVDAILAAIAADDAAALDRAWAGCGRLCRSRMGRDDQLLEAADDGAHTVAARLIGGPHPARIGPEAPERDLWTCEGSLLVALDALSVAVARDDPAMVRLLLPLVQERRRRRALALSARLDRLDLLRLLIGSAITPEQSAALLSDASCGAALTVGAWLIEQQGRGGGTGEGGWRPLGRGCLVTLVRETGTPRAARFLAMLEAHGIDPGPLTPEERRLILSASGRPDSPRHMGCVPP